MIRSNYQPRNNNHNQAFTLIELLIYIAVISILSLLAISIFYSIIFYSNIYLDKVTFRNESFKILNKLYFNSIIATSVEATATSIKFNLNPGGYEKIFLTSSRIYLEDESTSAPFTSEKININEFNVSTTSDFYNVFIKMSNISNDQILNLTTTLYLWSF